MDTIDFSNIPSKEKLLEDSAIKPWIELLSRPLVSRIIDGTLGDVRSEASEGRTIPDYGDITERTVAACTALYRRRIHRVINGTGILLHTNMGRSPILKESWEACKDVNTSYSNLEFDLATGKRGKRNGIVPELLSLLTGAESSMLVNNNAAAVFLVLSVLAAGREVIVSRGEQVQIGGGFRIPEILTLSGARLLEIGTTNITTLKDYQRAIHPDIAGVLSVHRSNFAIRGFTSQPSLSEIRKVLPEKAFLFVDQGSGTLSDEIRGEKPVRQILREGADLVSFSCDKVLGGPQGGVICGKTHLIRLLEEHQLYRVFRPGKTVFSLLEDILIKKLNGNSYLQERLFLDRGDLQTRASRIAEKLPEKSLEIVPTGCSSGGGSSPDERYPSIGLRFLSSVAPDTLIARLRSAEVPVIGYISDNMVYIDLAAIDPADDALLTKTIDICLQDTR